MNKFVSPHPRASGDGYVVLREQEAAVQQQVAHHERPVLSVPLLGNKSFKGSHYLSMAGTIPIV